MSERILIIDDEERIRKLLIMYLEKEGYIVDEASNGHDGLERLKFMDYSCVLLDVQLPMLNGKSILSWAVQKKEILEVRSHGFQCSH